MSNKEKIIQLQNKAARLTTSLWAEPKSNMYKKNMVLLTSITSQVDELRKMG